jgi:hypothetical protein
MKSKCSLLCHNSPALVYNPNYTNPSPPITILRSILIASSHLRLGLSSGLVLSAYYIRSAHKGGGELRVRSPPKSKFKETDFVNTIMLKASRDLPFSRKQCERLMTSALNFEKYNITLMIS